MYSIIYGDNVENKIKDFINWYKKQNLDTFTDTGLFYEQIIRESYINNSKKFKKDIFDGMANLFIQEKVLGYKILKNNNFEITLTIGNYKLFIEYSEDSNKKVRFIENMKIFSK